MVLVLPQFIGGYYFISNSFVLINNQNIENQHIQDKTRESAHLNVELAAHTVFYAFIFKIQIWWQTGDNDTIISFPILNSAHIGIFCFVFSLQLYMYIYYYGSLSKDKIWFVWIILYHLFNNWFGAEIWKECMLCWLLHPTPKYSI